MEFAQRREQLEKSPTLNNMIIIPINMFRTPKQFYKTEE